MPERNVAYKRPYALPISDLPMVRSPDHAGPLLCQQRASSILELYDVATDPSVVRSLATQGSPDRPVSLRRQSWMNETREPSAGHGIMWNSSPGLISAVPTHRTDQEVVGLESQIIPL